MRGAGSRAIPPDPIIAGTLKSGEQVMVIHYHLEKRQKYKQKLIQRQRQGWDKEKYKDKHKDIFTATLKSGPGEQVILTHYHLQEAKRFAE